MTLPRLTVITPTYNRAPFLEATIRSVLAQDYEPLDYLVLDDGSTDGTPELLERFSRQYPDRFRWVRHENVGQAATVNRGFELARGELISLVSSDDPLPPAVLSSVVNVLVRDPDVVLAYPDVSIVDEDGATLMHIEKPECSLEELLRWQECIPSAGAVFRRSVVDAVGGWDSSYRTIPDFEFLIRAALVGRFVRVPGTTATWTRHSGSISRREHGERMARERVRAVETFLARSDVPEEIHAHRVEILRMTYIAAGTVMNDTPNQPGDRFHVIDRLEVVSSHRSRLQSHGNDPALQIVWLHGEVAERDRTVSWLHREVAERDRTIARLHGEAAARDRQIDELRRLVPERSSDLRSMPARTALKPAGEKS